MRKTLAAGILLLIGIVACEKQSDDPQPTPTQSTYFPLTDGSYWVYQGYEIDSRGSETLRTETDTIRVLYDTLIDGEVYKVIHGRKWPGFNGPKVNRFYRDSSGYVVNQLGEILMSSNEFDVPLYTYHEIIDTDTLYSYVTKMRAFNAQIALPAGNFNNLLDCEFQVLLEGMDAQPLRTNHNLYARGVGRVKFQYFYMYEYQRQGTYYEARLMDYHIAQ